MTVGVQQPASFRGIIQGMGLAKMVNILIIDDDEFVRKTLKTLLIYRDYAVDVAKDGSSGMEKAKSDCYDIVLLDINLPDKTGFDVLKDIKSAKLKASVIMMTGNASPETEENARRLGAVNYLSKPIMPGTLFTAIRNVH
jgi:DNA-binding response OmpR family regulator